jgi:hypothetical protein
MLQTAAGAAYDTLRLADTSSLPSSRVGMQKILQTTWVYLRSRAEVSLLTFALLLASGLFFGLQIYWFVK